MAFPSKIDYRCYYVSPAGRDAVRRLLCQVPKSCRPTVRGRAVASVRRLRARPERRRRSVRGERIHRVAKRSARFARRRRADGRGLGERVTRLRGGGKRRRRRATVSFVSVRARSDATASVAVAGRVWRARRPPPPPPPPRSAGRHDERARRAGRQRVGKGIGRDDAIAGEFSGQPVAVRTFVVCHLRVPCRSLASTRSHSCVRPYVVVVPCRRRALHVLPHAVRKTRAKPAVPPRFDTKILFSPYFAACGGGSTHDTTVRRIHIPCRKHHRSFSFTLLLPVHADRRPPRTRVVCVGIVRSVCRYCLCALLFFVVFRSRVPFVSPPAPLFRDMTYAGRRLHRLRRRENHSSSPACSRKSHVFHGRRTVTTTTAAANVNARAVDKR